jgi:hypothetical protein
MRIIYILLIVIFYFLVKDLLLKFFTYDNLFSNIENYDNLSQSIFIQNYSKYNEYPIKKKTEYSEKFEPIILTDYKFSETFKLGYELSKLIPMEVEHSLGMYSNLKKLQNENNSYQMAFCTENDYYKAIQNNDIDKNSIKFICSFFRMEFILVLNARFKISSYIELLKLISERSSGSKDQYLKVGMLNNNNSSYHDGIEIFKLLKITENTKGVKINTNYKSMRDLIYAFDREDEDMIFMTTTNKNPFLINFLKTNFINIIGTNGIKDFLIKAKFPHIFKENLDVGKYNRIVEENYDNLSYNSSENLGKKKVIKSFSTRLILVAKSTLPDEYVLKLLRNIYGHINELKKSMNDYFLNKRNNILNKLLDPYEMFFTKNDILYHEGARNFYEEVKFITYDSEHKKPYNKIISSKLLTENIGPYERLSISK